MLKRVVCDVNIYISALMNPKGVPGLVVAYLLKNKSFEIVISTSIIEEFQRVLLYPKVRKFIAFTDFELHRWVEALIVCSHMVDPRFKYETIVQEDPDDDRYIIAALESKSSYLVTGDRHLLNLSYSGPVKILTAREFLDTINT